MNYGLKLLLVHIFIGNVLLLPAQNLINNGNFELYTSLPSDYGQYYKAIGWTNTGGTNSGSPDYFHTSGTVPTQLGQITPISGMGQMGLTTYVGTAPNMREYISTQLNTPMIAGQRYTVAFYMTKGAGSIYTYSTNGIGIYFSAGPPPQQNGYLPLNVTPQIEITSILRIPYNVWEEQVFTYTATGNENFFTLGNFRPDSTTMVNSGERAAYYFFDSIRVIPCTNLSAPVLTTVHPSCSEPTGTITINSPTGTGFTYSINGTNYLNTSGVFTGLDAGIYTVTANNNGCISPATTVVLNNPPGAPAAPQTVLTQPTCTQTNGAITVTTPLGAGLSYSIDGSDYSNITGIFSNLASGSYNVTVKNSSGCVSPVTIAVINNLPNGPATPQIMVSQPTCTQQTGTITVTSPIGTGLSYSINGTNYSNTTGIFTNLASGNYSVTIKDSSGCVSNSSVSVINSLPTFQIQLSASPNPANPGSPIILTVSGSSLFNVNSWQPATLFSNQTLLQQTVSVNTPTWISVIASSLQGCKDTSSILLNVNAVPGIWIPNSFTPNNDGLNDVFGVLGNGASKVELTVWNRWGEQVFFSAVQSNTWDGTHKGKQQPMGSYTYLVRIFFANGSQEVRKGSVLIIR